MVLLASHRALCDVSTLSAAICVSFTYLHSTASLISHIPWAMPLMQRIPFIAQDLVKMRKLGVDSAMSRLKRGSISKDLWYYLVTGFHVVLPR